MDMPLSKAERNPELKVDVDLQDPSKVTVLDPLFFQVKFGKKKFYVLGTMHVLPLSSLPSPVKKLMKTIKTLVVEDSCTDFDDADIDIDIKTTEEELAFEGILLEPGEVDYFSLLPTSIKERLQNLLSKISIKTGGNQIKINYLYSLLENEVMILAGNGMDGDLAKAFRDQDIEILELDELSVNEEVFEEEYRNLEPCESYASLYHWEEDYDPVMKVAIEQQVQSYCRGDIESLMTDANCEAERNLSWIPKIMYAHKYKPSPCLFAFGAGHLGGAYGILSILQQSGGEILKMNNQGRFVPFRYKGEPGVSASHVEAERQTYQSFRQQILEPTSPSIAWLYSMKDSLAREQWKQEYKKPMQALRKMGLNKRGH